MIVALGFMSFHSIYTTLFRGRGLDHYDRHKAFIVGESPFFNPWQYRVLAPLLVEGVHSTFKATVFRGIDFESISEELKKIDPKSKDSVTRNLLDRSHDLDYLEYLLVFILFRWVLNVLLFYLIYCYFKHFTENRYLLFGMILFVSLCIGNSVNDCDFSFNTIIDVIVYLLGGLMIVKKWNPWWILALSIVGSFNRETAILLPGLYFLSQVDFQKMKVTNFTYLKKPLLITTASYFLFIFIFISIRAYFGYRPPEEWRVASGLSMLKLNLASIVSIKSYFEMYGTMLFLPFLIFIRRDGYSKFLIMGYFYLLPIWIITHLTMVVAYQSRLFLVPTVLILFPMLIELIESNYTKEKLSV